MSTRHRWADVIAAWANGEAIQFLNEMDDEWHDWAGDEYCSTPHFESRGTKWRIKPRMCSLNGYEFPEPIREAPPEGGTVWLADLTSSNLAIEVSWDNTTRFARWLRHRRLHTTLDAAIAHARAEILAVGGTLEDES